MTFIVQSQCFISEQSKTHFKPKFVCAKILRCQREWAKKVLRYWSQEEERREKEDKVPEMAAPKKNPRELLKQLSMISVVDSTNIRTFNEYKSGDVKKNPSGTYIVFFKFNYGQLPATFLFSSIRFTNSNQLLVSN